MWPAWLGKDEAHAHMFVKIYGNENFKQKVYISFEANASPVQQLLFSLK